jgi:hypothetical protein
MSTYIWHSHARPRRRRTARIACAVVALVTGLSCDDFVGQPHDGKAPLLQVIADPGLALDAKNSQGGVIIIATAGTHVQVVAYGGKLLTEATTTPESAVCLDVPDRFRRAPRPLRVLLVRPSEESVDLVVTLFDADTSPASTGGTDSGGGSGGAPATSCPPGRVIAEQLLRLKPEPASSTAADAGLGAAGASAGAPAAGQSAAGVGGQSGEGGLVP